LSRPRRLRILRADSRYLDGGADGEVSERQTDNEEQHAASRAPVDCAAVGLAFGVVYRYFLDDPSEASVANYIRSGVHGMSVAFAAWGAPRRAVQFAAIFD
jgi:hypothetical protein